VRRIAGPALGALGLAVIVAGTFLPWLDSGARTRNSYQAGGVARRLLDLSGWRAAGLAVWPFVGLACAIVIALYALELRRMSAGLGLLVGAAAAAVSAGVLSINGTDLIGPANSGPIVTIIGATAVITASSLLLLQHAVRTFRS
jgi:hypothetical protein